MSSKMIRRRERGEVLKVPEIPFDLQIEIVNRLPIKSLARFKCVSKLWSSLISSKGYLFASPPRLYITLVEKFCHNPVKSVLLSLASTSSTSFKLDTRMQGMGGYNLVVFRGLILYTTVCEQACIYNPTTRQRVTLPTVESNILDEEEKEMGKVYFFGYDPVLEQYKVVCMLIVWSIKNPTWLDAYYWVLVLEAGSSWKRIKYDHPHIPTRPTRPRLCINGVIYYFATNFTFVVQFMSFDVRSEEFSMIQLPHAVSENAESVGLIEYGGKPTIFDYTNLKDSLVKLWVLEHTGKWSLVLQPCQMHFVSSNIYFEVIGTTQKGEVILKPGKMSYPYYILYYDLHKKDWRRVDIQGISNHDMDLDKSIFHLVQMDTGESIMHLKI